MARKRVSQGKTIKDILKMNVSTLQGYSVREQREIVSRLASAANKRLRGLESKDIETPATIKLKMSGGKVSVKGKSEDELLNEFYRARQFLNAKTSTRTGWKNVEKGVEKAIQDIEKINIHKGMSYNALIGKAFAYYDTLKEVDPSLVMNRDKYKVAEYIADLIYQNDDMNISDIMNRATQYIMDTYEAEQERYNSTAQRLGQRITPDIPDRMR